MRYQNTKSLEWEEYSQPSDEFFVISSEYKMISPPVLISKDSSSITIKWDDIKLNNGYMLRYRDESSCESWIYVDSIIRNNSVKKKGLEKGKVYYFSVKPIVDTVEYAYSLSSTGLQVAVLSEFLRNLFPTKLQSKISGLSYTQELLAGKIIGVYFSAHWCQPCRNFTPQLAEFYNQAKSLNKNFEIIFCSGDHDEQDFNNYYAQSMPWLAIPFEDNAREELMGKFDVKGIPKLSILGASGRIIVENAVGQNLSMEVLDKWVEQGLDK